MQPQTTQLIRGLGLVAAISVNVSNVIGTGVFLKARVMTCNIVTPGKALMVWVFAGLLSLAGARFLSGLLFGVSARDPLVFVAVSALVTIAALLACLIPGRRALRIDPLLALRAE